MSKGSRREREAVEIWRDAGYSVYRPATVRFGENDIFGVFDLLAVNPPAGLVDAVQVKSNRAAGIQEWTDETRGFRSLGWRTLYAVPVDNSGWRLLRAAHGSHTTVYDGRESLTDMGEGLRDVLDLDTANSTVAGFRGWSVARP